MLVSDLKKIAPLVAAYELQPGKHYVVIAGKGISYEKAYALLKDVRENHPELSIFVIATRKPKDLEIAHGTDEPIPDGKENSTERVPRI